MNSTFISYLFSLSRQQWLFIILYIVICGIISFIIGHRRQIGIWWTWFFSIFLTIIVGAFIGLLSRNYFKDAPKKSSQKTIIGYFFATLYGILTIWNFQQYPFNQYKIIISIGLCGFGIYLIQVGKGRIPNKPSIKEIFLRNVKLEALENPTIDSHPEQNSKEEIKGATSKIGNTLSENWLNNQDILLRHFIYLIISLFVGFLLGVYNKLPNADLMAHLNTLNNPVQRAIALETIENRFSFFSMDLFKFNWVAFLLSTLICFLSLLFFTDVKLRKFLLDKLISGVDNGPKPKVKDTVNLQVEPNYPEPPLLTHKQLVDSPSSEHKESFIDETQISKIRSYHKQLIKIGTLSIIVRINKTNQKHYIETDKEILSFPDEYSCIKFLKENISNVNLPFFK